MTDSVSECTWISQVKESRKNSKITELPYCIIQNWRWQKNCQNIFLKSWMSFIKQLKLIFTSSRQFFTADKKNLITGINVSVEFIINLSQNPYHFSLQVFPKLWEANTRSMVATIFILMMLRTLHYLSKKPRCWRVQNNVVTLREKTMRCQAHHTQRKAPSTLDLPFSVL